MGDLTWRFAAGESDQPLNIIGGDGRFARLAASFTEKPVDACLDEPPLPAPNRRPADTRKPRNFSNVQPIRRMQNDPNSAHMLLRSVTIGDDRFQANTILSRDNGTDIMEREEGMAYHATNVNLLNASLL